MKKLTIILLIISCSWGCSEIKREESKVSRSIIYGMSHNDYAQERPLQDALDNRIGCVEADLCIVDSNIYVSHATDEIIKESTLESAYLKPLHNYIVERDGSVYGDGETFYLYLDLKTEESDLQILFTLLKQYRSILSYTDIDGYHPGPVKVIGLNWELIKDENPRYLFAEGKFKDIESNKPGSSIFIINERWSDLFSWNGIGEMPIEEELRLKAMSNRAHKRGRILRFWETYDREGEQRDRLWSKLLNCGVDLISSDDLEGISNFNIELTSKKDVSREIEINSRAKIESHQESLKCSSNSSNFLDIEYLGIKRVTRGALFMGEDSMEISYIKSIDNSSNIKVLGASKFKDIELPISLLFNDIPNLKAGVVSYMFGDWESWTKPARFTTLSEFPKEKGEFSIWQYSDGVYGVMIPLCDNNTVSTLGGRDGKFGAVANNFNSKVSEKTPMVMLGFDSDPYRLIEDIYREAMVCMGRENNLRVNKDYPKAFENIAWCTWNAMYEDVSGDKIKDGIESFKSIGVAIPTLLIDDGWLQVTKDEKLKSYKFDSTKFPNGAASLFKELKDEFGVSDIGVWHTLNGYWAGVDKSGELYSEQSENLVPYRDKLSVHDKELSKDTFYGPSPEGNRAYNFYSNWYNYLAKQGISFVKVDQQSVIKRLAKGHASFTDTPISFGELANSLEGGLQRAIREHFNGQVINCQDMAVEALYNMGSSAIIRNSDDFFPDRTAYYSIDVEKGNAAVHAIMNIHNSLWTSNIGWPDFDMFQSHHKDAEYHAIQRAISGGPVYVSDKPHKQNADIIKRLISSSGQVIRADIPARPTEDCLFNINIEEPLKAFSTLNGSGLLAIWNSDDSDEVSGEWSPKLIDGLQGDSFAAFKHGSEEIKIIDMESTLPISLKRMGYEYWNIVPMTDRCAVIGLIDKYNACGTVLATTFREGTIGTTISEGGKVGIVIPNSPKKIEVDGERLNDNWSYSNNLLIVDYSSSNSFNIEVTF